MIVMLTLETWRPVLGYEAIYEASDIGRIRSVDRIDSLGRPQRGRILRARINGQGYRTVMLSTHNNKRVCRVHRLACAAFHGAPPPNAVVRHLDGDSLNNCIENLSWGTISENQHDRVRHGRNYNAEKVTCNNGHPFTGNNLRLTTNQRRVCRACNRGAVARYKARKAAR